MGTMRVRVRVMGGMSWKLSRVCVWGGEGGCCKRGVLQFALGAMWNSIYIVLLIVFVCVCVFVCAFRSESHVLFSFLFSLFLFPVY